MTTLDPKSGYYTLINTFTVEPDRAEELFTILSRATEEGMRQLPGFISANLHISSDKKHIANYVQWRTKADNDAMMANPDAKKHMAEAGKLATSFEPIYYELRETHAAA